MSAAKWWDGELRFSLKWSGLALALAYAVAFLVLRDHSVNEWYLPAGLRIAALLFFPYRYWPYLFVGELAAFTYLRLPLVEKYGLPWAIIASSVLMPMAAAIVYLHRKWIRLDHKYWFLSVAVLAAVSFTALNIGSNYFFMHPSSVPITWDRSIRYMMGHYQGILMLAPLVVLWKQRKLDYPFPRKLRWDALISLAIIAALCIAVTWTGISEEQKNYLRVLMILPAVALTYLHGWRGAVIGVIAVNLGIRLTLQTTGLPGSYDPNAFIAQVNLAVVATALLGLGMLISHYYQNAWQKELIAQQAIATAKTSSLLGEHELRVRATRLKAIGEDIESAFQKAATWLRDRGHHELALSLQRNGVIQTKQLREALNLIYPTEIEIYGLYLVLQSSAIAKVWEQTARIFTRLQGNPCALSVGLQVVAYRSICDVVSILLEAEPGSLIVRARCGKLGVDRGIVINIAPLDGGGVRLRPETLNHAVSAIAARTLAYGGKVHGHRNRVSLLLREPVNAPRVTENFAITSRMTE